MVRRALPLMALVAGFVAAEISVALAAPPLQPPGCYRAGYCTCRKVCTWDGRTEQCRLVCKNKTTKSLQSVRGGPEAAGPRQHDRDQRSQNGPKNRVFVTAPDGLAAMWMLFV